MAVFSYRALNAQGKNVKGIVDAENIRSARQKLKQQGIFATSLEETETNKSTLGSSNVSRPGKKRVSTVQLAVVTRQLATLLTAGMPLVDSLKALGDQIDQPYLKSVFVEVCDKVNEGSTYANSLRDYPKIFPKLYINMVASGEASGSLDSVLQRIADLLDAQVVMQRKIISALTYPVLMLLLCFGVILLLLGYVVPQITKIFESRKAALPLPTRVIIALSNGVQEYWPIILAVIILLAVYFIFYRKTEKGRKNFDKLILRLPLIGTLRLKIATSRLARNLGLMLASGIELLTALNIAKNIVGNVVLEAAVENAANGVREGRSLANELSKSGLYPKLLLHMVAIGERTGQLENMLLRAADAYEAEVDTILGTFASILEPLLIIFLALIVGAILAAVLLPMLEMTSLIKS